MKKLRTIVADDSEPQLKTLCHELEEFCPQVQIVAKTLTLSATYEAIKTFEPDLLVLDVEFHAESGTAFNLIERLQIEGDIQFLLIFVSGHAREKNYATLAADYSALQCLQKPVSPQKLQKAVELAEAWFGYQGNQEVYNQQIKSMMDLLRTKDFRKPFFIKSIRNQWISLDPEEVLYLESDGKQTIFFLTQDRKAIGMESIGDYEYLTENYSFVRIHQSYIVNLDNVSLFHSQERYLKMKNGKIINTSRSGASLLRVRFSQR
ncbi:LytR/AlgR family response regulator transcription factor [Arundinibacter roseus]|uniref:Response regulator transcription factor n=1 Tax=Arundinibacter roseus TaxID=2070510 RepID=A0A4R4KLD5_9BACT|nr:LytTR family DNA-binding domain-containing protein [Arundinibacter roseus]TDB69164.1 response regulator transcription factor [Arundinibacter roseus]